MKIAGFGGRFGEVESGAAPVAKPVAEVTPKVTGNAQTSISRGRPTSSFKIKDTLLQESRNHSCVKVQAPIEQQEKIEMRNPFNEATVVAALEKYVADHKPEQSVDYALKTHRPLVEGEKVVLLVDHQLQMEKLEAIRKHLLNGLMKYLNNGFIVLEFRLFDSGTSQEEKRFFTASEKLEHFVKLNPVVAELKSVFGLELE